jgi:hypothetical protein
VTVDEPKAKPTPVLVRVRITEAAPDPSKVTLSLADGAQVVPAIKAARAIDLPSRIVIAVQGTERFLNKAVFAQVGNSFAQLAKADASASSKATVFALGKQATKLSTGSLSELGSTALGPIDKFRDAIVFAPEIALPEVIDELQKEAFDGRTYVVVISSPTTLAEAVTTTLKQRLRTANLELHYVTIEGDDEPSDSARTLAGERAHTIKKPSELGGVVNKIANRIASDTELVFEVPDAAWRASKEARIELGGHARRIETGGKTTFILD